MNPKKKIILITIISIIVLIAIIGITCFIVLRSKDDNSQPSKISKLYDKLEEKNNYGVTITLDEKNKTYYAKQGNKAYAYDIYDGEGTKFITRDGNSYLLRDRSKVYYTYNNNESDLERVKSALIEVKDSEYTTGKEKIEDKKYSYEEYNQSTTFSMMDLSEIDESQEVKTRFYFEKDDLRYIKTIMGDKQELLKVEIEYGVDSNLFELPKDYQQR